LSPPGAITAPIVGATRPRDDAVAAEQLQLSDDDLERLEEPYVPHRIAGH
jgi:aryl-alcohol dehydrogenase-like predicted oxidoreductase